MLEIVSQRSAVIKWPFFEGLSQSDTERPPSDLVGGREKGEVKREAKGTVRGRIKTAKVELLMALAEAPLISYPPFWPPSTFHGPLVLAPAEEPGGCPSRSMRLMEAYPWA